MSLRGSTPPRGLLDLPSKLDAVGGWGVSGRCPRTRVANQLCGEAAEACRKAAYGRCQVKRGGCGAGAR
eukprot:129994-Alexandrium_andersonii.AAC.1